MHHKGQENPSRKLEWVEGQSVGGWGCSNCAWVFRPSNLPSGTSVDELAAHAQRQLDQEFAAHDCAEHPHQGIGAVS